MPTLGNRPYQRFLLPPINPGDAMSEKQTVQVFPKKLSATAIEKIKPRSNRREIPDGARPNLYLVIQPSGRKSWAVRYRFYGRARKLTLTGFPSLATARKLAQDAMDAVAEGRDPAQEKREARTANVERIDFESALRDFFRKHTRKKNGDAIRESTRRERARLLGLKPDPARSGEWIRTGNGALKRWNGRTLESITKADVLDLLDVVAEAGPVLANRTLAALRTFFGWCVKRDRLSKSPCDGVDDPSPEKTRDRVLSDPELSAVWHESEKEGFPFGRLVQMLILTGCRLGEVRGALWSEINTDRREWLIPGARTKNGRDHLVPLSDSALAIFDIMPEIKGTGLIFTTTGKTPYSGITRAKQRLQKAVAKRLSDAPERWTLHDLRRTFVTGLQRLGFPLEIAEACVNHKSGTLDGVAGIYARHDYAEEKQRAFAAWARHVEAIVSGEPAKVVSLRPAASQN